MATLAELIIERDALTKVLNSGVLNLREGEKAVGYRPTADMTGRLEAIKREIAALEGKVKTVGVFPSATKGW